MHSKKIVLACLVTIFTAASGCSSDESNSYDPAAPVVPSLNPGEKHLAVPSDSKASYVVLSTSGEWPNRKIITKRIGPSGVGFSERIYDCDAQLVKYLGTGDSYDEMKQSQPDANMAPIVSESIAYYVGRAACER